MTSLLSTIVVAKLRESAGSRTAARYDFQLNASFLKILEWHAEGTDYLAIFDYVEDLVLIANPGAGGKASLYQIKSKASGHWSAPDIARLAKGALPQSIVGKMYSGVLALEGNSSRAVFLSNADFKFKLPDGTSTTADHIDIEASKLHQDEISRLTKALDSDFAPPRAYEFIPLLRFERTGLGIQSQSDLVIGKLVSFFETEFSAKAVPVTAVYQTISEKIRRKSANSDVISTEPDLLKSKCLTRSEIEDLLKRAAASATLEKLWALADAEFAQVKLSTREKIDLRNFALKYSLDRNGGHPSALVVHRRAQEILFVEANTVSKIDGLLNLADFLASCVGAEPPFEGVALRAAMMVEAIEEMNGGK